MKSHFNLPRYTFSDVALADIDNDGILDLVVGCEDLSNWAGYLYALRPDGTVLAGFTQTMSDKLVMNAASQEPVVADVDGDYRYEILFGNLLHSDGTTMAGWPIGQQWTTGLLGQLDGTGNLEFIGGAYHNDYDRAYRSDGTFLFDNLCRDGESVAYWSPGMQDSSIGSNPVLDDVNGDGQLDVVKTGERTFANPAIRCPSTQTRRGRQRRRRLPALRRGGSARHAGNHPLDAHVRRSERRRESRDGGRRRVVALRLDACGRAEQLTVVDVPHDYRNTGTLPATGGLSVFRVAAGTNEVIGLGTANASGQGAVMRLAATNGPEQLFKTDLAGTNQYHLRNYLKNACFYVDPTAPSAVTFRPCATGANMAFALVPLGGGAFQVRQVSTGLCLVTQGSAGTALTTAACASGSAVSAQSLQPTVVEGENLATTLTGRTCFHRSRAAACAFSVHAVRTRSTSTFESTSSRYIARSNRGGSTGGGRRDAS